jgi:starch-binding outer membrane protein, SusD/RagB family
MKTLTYIFVFTVLMSAMTSCKKYLEAKSNQSLSTPSTLADLEALLNHPTLPNRGTVMLNGLTDEYFYKYAEWQSRNELFNRGYIWDPQLNDYTDWAGQYNAVLYANTALYNLEQISSNGETERRNKIKGTALFFRALAFYRIALLYAPQYDSSSAQSDLGIPLRLKADINDVSIRSSVQQTYERIIADLKEAVSLLPNNVPNTNISKSQPTKVAAHALLARVYLQAGAYQSAKEHANAALQIYSTLMDFNDNTWVNLNTTSGLGFKQLNPEVILHSSVSNSPASFIEARVDTNLYNSYNANDLRKAAYFLRNPDGTYRFKGSYAESLIEVFCGIATDELYLIRAECNAREGDLSNAMKDLNDLLRTRWRKVNNVTTYVDQTAINTTDALAKIISERKKELVFREVRWADLKRLNKQSNFSQTLTRSLNNQLYSLPPNDLRYTLLIPIEVLNVTNLQQNPR